MDCDMLVVYRQGILSTYLNQKVGIGSPESRNFDHCRQKILPVKCLVQVDTEFRLHTQRLQQECTHSNDTLLGGIRLVFCRVIEDQNDKVMSSFGINHVRSETLVALRNLPKEHDDLWGKLCRRRCSRNVRVVGLKGLVQNPRHAIDNELKVLWSMQSSEKVTIVVLWC